MSLVLMIATLTWGIDQTLAKDPANGKGQGLNYHGKVTPAERKAAAERAVAGGFTLPQIGEAIMAVPGAAPHYFSHPNYANSPSGIRKFVDGLPGLGPSGMNNLGQYIPVAVPDTTTYPGSDYYEIAVVQYREQMHSDLPCTLLRGYVQLSTDNVPGRSGSAGQRPS